MRIHCKRIWKFAINTNELNRFADYYFCACNSTYYRVLIDTETTSSWSVWAWNSPVELEIPRWKDCALHLSSLALHSLKSRRFIAMTATVLTTLAVAIPSTAQPRSSLLTVTQSAIHWTSTLLPCSAEKSNREVNIFDRLPLQNSLDALLSVDNDIRVIRSCGYVEGQQDMNSCERRSISHSNEVRYCQCDGNLCNGSESVFKSLKVFTLVCATIALLANKVF